MKLISMTDYVEWIKFKNPEEFASDDLHDGVRGKFNRICLYAKFLKQPLTLGMFVPCDEERNVLEEPDRPPSSLHLKMYESELNQYQQAKERVLFEGFKMFAWNHSKDTPFMIGLDKSFGCVYWLHEDGWSLSKGIKTVEDLILYQPTLTKSAIKQLGL